MKTALSLKITFYPKRNECDAKGRCPLMGRLFVNGSQVCFSARMSVPLALWGSRGGRAEGRSREALTINEQLDHYRASAYGCLERLSTRFDHVDARQVKEAMLGMACSAETLLQVFAAHNEECRKRIGICRTKRTFENHERAYHRLSAFLKKQYRLPDIAFPQLNVAFIERYDHYLRVELKLQPGSMQQFINPLRHLIKIAIGKGLIDRDPFATYRLERKKYAPRYLSKSDFDKLLTALLDANLSLVRDMFVLASLTGLAHNDLYNLTSRNLVCAPDGKLWLEIARRKTGTKSEIPLLPLAAEIIHRYKGMTRSDQLLPVHCLCSMNGHLKTIAKLCGITVNLTFHVARHTFATQHTLSRGVPIESVSHMMGHTSIRTTQLYAEVTSEKIYRDIEAWKTRVDKRFTLSNLNH